MTDLFVDTNGVFARSWFSADGDADLAISKSLTLALSLFDPMHVGTKIDRALFCWDGNRKNDKNRPDKPPGYYENREIVKALLTEVTGVAAVTLYGEADDTVATAVAKSNAEKVIVATGDKDLHQLSDSRTKIYCLNKHSFLSKRDICSKWGVKSPLHIAIALAITGDKIDNIKGVSGWGDKRAKSVLEGLPDNCTFDEAVSEAMAIIPEEKHEEFTSALTLTLLDQGLDGVPEATPVNFMPLEKAESSGITRISPEYVSVAMNYLPT